jgi:Saxitoxin biosynthesis operon protein SxtJ
LSHPSPTGDAALPSERKFGVLFTVVFAVLTVYVAWKAWSLLAIGACAVLAAGFGVATLVNPAVLAPLNRAWFALGVLLGRIISPIVLGAMFFLLITPIGVIARAFGRDELRLKPRDVNSYWRERSDPVAAAESFKNQF